MSDFAEYLRKHSKTLFDTENQSGLFQLLEKKYQVTLGGNEAGQDEVIVTADNMESAFRIASENLDVNTQRVLSLILDCIEAPTEVVQVKEEAEEAKAEKSEKK